MLKYPVVVAQEELDRFNKPIQAAAKARTFGNKPQRRDSGTIQSEINRNSEPLERFTRNLSEYQERRTQVVKVVGDTEAKIAELKAGGVPSNHVNLQRLTGYSFTDKAGMLVRHDGILDRLKAELLNLDVRIETLKEAVEKHKAHCDSLIPTLQAELAEAKQWERITT
jgi:chromosome segregation ATPase